MILRPNELVTVFGGDGFIGRYVCEYLLRAGVRVRVANRDPRNSYFIQPLAQVGQFGRVRADIRDPKSVARALDGASAAVNLVGVFGSQMQRAHVDGARHIAEGVKSADARALVQISALGADPTSVSNYGRTKAEGEQAVKQAFKPTTIIRPSLVFGPEDDLTNRFASMAQWPVLPVIAAKRKFQPVYVRDLAQAIGLAVLNPGKHGGKTYEIGGPLVMTMLEMQKAIAELAGQKPEIVVLPDIAGTIMSWFGFLPGAPMTRDQWLMLNQDKIVSPGAAGLEAFGIKPTPLGAVGGEWLGRYRGNRFAGRRVNLTAVS
jgi:NADH dehydrogenase